MVDIVEGFGSHVGGRFHQVLRSDELKLLITNRARVVLLDSELVG